MRMYHGAEAQKFEQDYYLYLQLRHPNLPQLYATACEKLQKVFIWIHSPDWIEADTYASKLSTLDTMKFDLKLLRARYRRYNITKWIWDSLKGTSFFTTASDRIIFFPLRPHKAPSLKSELRNELKTLEREIIARCVSCRIFNASSSRLST